MKNNQNYDDFLKHLGIKNKEIETNCKNEIFEKEVEKYLHPGILQTLKQHEDFKAKFQNENRQSKSLNKKIVKPQKTIDLHGMKLEKATSIVEHEIKRSYDKGFSIILVITGKGKHSPDGPVLKQSILETLRKSAWVAETKQAPLSLGGGGAWLVRLYSKIK